MNILARHHYSVKPGMVLALQGTIIGVLFLLIYAPLIPGLVHDWYAYENFSYGFLIPLITVYLLWRKREELRHARVETVPWVWGSAFLLGAVALGLAGKVIGDPFTTRISMILALAASLYLVLGKQFFRRMRFPVAYLFLMIPLPYLIVKELSYYLRFFDAVLAASALRAIGVPVHQDSYFLHLPDTILEVADVCSGVSSLFAMFAVGAVYAHFLSVRPGGKVLVMLGAIVFPVLANLLRIVLISAIVHYTGPEILRTTFHQFTGTFTFILSLALLIGLGEFLRRRGPWTVSGTARQERGTDAARQRLSGPSHTSARLFTPAVSSALAILVTALVLGSLLETRQAVALQRDLQTLPVQLGPYRSAADENWSDPYQDPDSERSVSRVYERPGSERVELFIGYKSSQQASDRLRSPKIHFSKGWNYVSVTPAELELAGSASIQANWMVIQNGSTTRIVLYWYQASGHTYSGEIEYRLAQVRNLVLHGRTEGAVVRIATPVYDHESPAQARARIEELAGHAYPGIAEILPR